VGGGAAAPSAKRDAAPAGSSTAHGRGGTGSQRVGEILFGMPPSQTTSEPEGGGGTTGHQPGAVRRHVTQCRRHGRTYSREDTQKRCVAATVGVGDTEGGRTTRRQRGAVGRRRRATGMQPRRQACTEQGWGDTDSQRVGAMGSSTPPREVGGSARFQRGAARHVARRRGWHGRCRKRAGTGERGAAPAVGVGCWGSEIDGSI